MRLLYYSSAFHARHGGSSHSREFVRFASRNPLVESITVFPENRSSEDSSALAARRVKAVFLNGPLARVVRFYRRNRFRYEALRRQIANTKPDVLLIRPDNNFLQVPRIKRDFPGILVATEVNSSPFDESYQDIAFREYFRARERKAYTAADANFFVSDHLRDTIIGPDRSHDRDHVVYNGVDPNQFVFAGHVGDLRKKLDLPVNRQIIGYVGTLDKHKKVEILLDAFAMVLKSHPDVFLLIVGDGAGRALLDEQIARLGIGGAVCITGWVPHSLVADYTFSIDVAVHHHANAYQCPLKLLEYMASGLPVVGPDIPFVRKNFTHGRHLLITSADAQTLARQIRAVLQNPVLAQMLRAGGKKHVVSHFTWQKNADTIIGVITNRLKRMSASSYGLLDRTFAPYA